MEIQQESYFLTINQFISVVIPIIGSGLFLFYVIFTKLSEIKSENKSLRDDLKEVYEENDKLKEDLDALKTARSKDLLDFTQSLNQFNITLTEFKGTLKHMDGTMREIKIVVENLKKSNG
jgi:predicted nuclease with TOPRIM domain